MDIRTKTIFGIEQLDFGNRSCSTPGNVMFFIGHPALCSVRCAQGKGTPNLEVAVRDVVYRWITRIFNFHPDILGGIIRNSPVVTVSSRATGAIGYRADILERRTGINRITQFDIRNCSTPLPGNRMNRINYPVLTTVRRQNLKESDKMEIAIRVVLDILLSCRRIHHANPCLIGCLIRNRPGMIPSICSEIWLITHDRGKGGTAVNGIENIYAVDWAISIPGNCIIFSNLPALIPIGRGNFKSPANPEVTAWGSISVGIGGAHYPDSHGMGDAIRDYPVITTTGSTVSGGGNNRMRIGWTGIGGVV